MLDSTQIGMHITTAILFMLPCLLLFLAWKSSLRADLAKGLPAWRKKVVLAALVVACVSTLVHLIWNVSWLSSGGSPHGMRAAPGIWQSLCCPLLWTFSFAIVLSLFARGKSRIFLLGWSLSMYSVFQAIYILQFD